MARGIMLCGRRPTADSSDGIWHRECAPGSALRPPPHEILIVRRSSPQYCRRQNSNDRAHNNQMGRSRMSRKTSTFLTAIGILGAAAAVQAATPDGGMPRMVGGGLRQMVAALETGDPRLRLELKQHVTSASGDPLVRVNLADGVTAEQALPQLQAAGFRLQAISSLNRSFLE